jgi:hypothetical protein
MVQLDMKDSQEHAKTPRSTFRKIKTPNNFLDYMTLMRSILEFDPSSF